MKDCDDVTIEGVLKFWPRHFSKLCMARDPSLVTLISSSKDPNRRVREATFDAFGALALRAQKKLAPHLKSVIK